MLLAISLDACCSDAVCVHIWFEDAFTQIDTEWMIMISWPKKDFNGRYSRLHSQCLIAANQQIRLHSERGTCIRSCDIKLVVTICS